MLKHIQFTVCSMTKKPPTNDTTYSMPMQDKLQSSKTLSTGTSCREHFLSVFGSQLSPVSGSPKGSIVTYIKGCLVDIFTFTYHSYRQN